MQNNFVPGNKQHPFIHLLFSRPPENIMAPFWIPRRKCKSRPLMNIKSYENIVPAIMVIISCMGLIDHVDAIYVVTITISLLTTDICINSNPFKNKYKLTPAWMSLFFYIHYRAHAINQQRCTKQTNDSLEPSLQNLNCCR